MTAPKDEQAEAFTLEDIIKEFGSAAQDPAELDTAAASQPTDERRPWTPSPLHNRNQRNRRNRSKNRPRQMRLRKKCRTHRADAAPEAALEPTPAPTPEAPAKKLAKPESPAPGRHAVRPPP